MNNNSIQFHHTLVGYKVLSQLSSFIWMVAHLDKTGDLSDTRCMGELQQEFTSPACEGRQGAGQRRWHKGAERIGLWGQTDLVQALPTPHSHLCV